LGALFENIEVLDLSLDCWDGDAHGLYERYDFTEGRGPIYGEKAGANREIEVELYDTIR
jgi:hypothetical protein